MSRYPDEYVQYLIYFHADRDYFECHEVLEEYWKEHPEDPRGGAYVVLIQIAVASYHERRGRRSGAAKMLQGAVERLARTSLAPLGLDQEETLARLEKRLRELEAGDKPFEDLNLPIADPELLDLCREQCRGRADWERPSPMEDLFLLNKHTLRDRSGVIAERLRQKELRLAERRSSSRPGQAEGQ
ncbi:hypothetical protein SAMN02799630_00292 [Paenibacillus sp. UNCCL117]|uniref:DUF309 domain-containing protein n=1 Tax=unclassified Paenibacillus TaxID=185978 RepID=UPI000883518B|nr:MULTISPECIES: DUF309 domain-containing protein [unclassified Paenibacillus]SDC45163.1 hypothetical protein SAMN04488602_102240 [Paenibacillus sp. cl123]SFW12581.1 hypothetical protein SAMN02799630_00292 [Paenibacillus sp. UNCCL117]